MMAGSLRTVMGGIAVFEAPQNGSEHGSPAGAMGLLRKPLQLADQTSSLPTDAANSDSDPTGTTVTQAAGAEVLRIE
jgi:hypothetical protein